MIKPDLCKRLLQFRKAIGKTQRELAEELNVYQSTITNIEQGKVYPNIHFLHYFNEKYRLDINWLLTGKGDIFIPEPIVKVGETGEQDFHVYLEREKIMEYSELLFLLEIPSVEFFISAKLTELKALLKDQLPAFYRKKEAELEKMKKAASLS